MSHRYGFTDNAVERVTAHSDLTTITYNTTTFETPTQPEGFSDPLYRDENAEITQANMKKHVKFYCCLCFQILFILLGLVLIGQRFFVPGFVTHQFRTQLHAQFVMSKSQQQSNNLAYQHWVSNNHSDAGQEIFKYYIYNVTNPKKVNLRIAKPIVQPIGPYIYRRYEFRTNVSFSNDSTKVSYDYTYKYEEHPTLMDPNLSFSDQIYVINPVHYVLRILNPVCQQNVSDFLLKGGKGQMFGWSFIKPNDIVHMEEYTGVGDLSKLRELIQYRSSKVDFWASPEWVNGSREFRLFPDNNWIDSHNELSIWAFDKYRKVKYQFREYTTLHGLKLAKYNIDPRVYENVTLNPANAKYYQFGDNGLLNLTARPNQLKKPVPTFAARKMFTDASKFLKNSKKDVYPFPMNLIGREIETFFEVDPRSGIVFHNHGATMISFRWDHGLKKGKGKENESRSDPGYVPFLYTIADAGATESNIKDYLSKLERVETIEQFSYYIAPCAGGVLFLFGVFLCCRQRWKRLQAEEGDFQRLEDVDEE